MKERRSIEAGEVRSKTMVVVKEESRGVNVTEGRSSSSRPESMPPSALQPLAPHLISDSYTPFVSIRHSPRIFECLARPFIRIAPICVSNSSLIDRDLLYNMYLNRIPESVI